MSELEKSYELIIKLREALEEIINLTDFGYADNRSCAIYDIAIEALKEPT